MAMKFPFLGHYCIKQNKWLQLSKSKAFVLNRNLTVVNKNKRNLSTMNETSSISSMQVLQAVNYPNKWNRAITNAEKLLRYPDLFVLPDKIPWNDITSLSQEIRKIYGSNHPVLRVIMNLIYDGQNNIQSRGLIALLLGKTIGIPPEQELRLNEINERQKTTATIMQLVYYGTEIHKTVTDNDVMNCDSQTYDELANGNKITILLGDFLLAKANILLSDIEITEVTYIISTAIRDITESEFMYDNDKEGKPHPSKNTQLSDWERHSYLSNASILANGCKSMAIIAHVDKSIQDIAFEFGKQLGLAWKASDDIREFVTVSEYPLGMRPFSLVSCPVILQLQKDPDRLDFVYTRSKTGNNANFKKIHEILSADSAVFNGAREICEKHKLQALNLLREFPESTYRIHLEDVISALGVDELSSKLS